jgi:hypothetical protein
MSLIGRLIKLTPAHWRVLGEAVFGLAIAAILLRFWSFRRIAARIGHVQPAHASAVPFPPAPLSGPAERIAWGLSAAARHVPWPALCLVQALAGVWMLRRRQMAYQIILGVRRGDHESLSAHAWLTMGEGIVTGGHEDPAGYNFVAILSRS